MNQDIKDLIEISRYYGKDKSFVIAGGGNTSFKDNEQIWIKASGVSLETIDEGGFVTLLREKLKLVSSKVYSTDAVQREADVKADLTSAITSAGNNRPSVETSLHEIIDYQFVVHTHPTKVNGLMCSVMAQEVCSELFGDSTLFVPYTDPGYILFKKVEGEIVAFTEKFGRAPQVIFLENHGVFVAANTTDEIHMLYDSIIQKLNERISPWTLDSSVQPFTSRILENIPKLNEGFVNSYAIGHQSNLISHFVKNRESFLKANTAFSPDDIVYCKAHYLFLENEGSEPEQINSARIQIANYKSEYGYLPKVIAIKGEGIIAVEESIKSVMTVLEVYTNILKISYLSENFGGQKFMNDAEIAFIDNWEVENYRRKIAKS